MPVVIVGFGFFVAEYILFLVLSGAAVVLFEKPIEALLMQSEVPVFLAVVILGLVTYMVSLSKAIDKEDWRWVADHFLAPSVAMVFAFVLYYPVISLAHEFTDVNGSAFLGDVLGFFISILALVVFFGAPVMAVMAMTLEDAGGRLLAYLAFIVVALTWGVALIAVSQHKSPLQPTTPQQTLAAARKIVPGQPEHGTTPVIDQAYGAGCRSSDNQQSESEQLQGYGTNEAEEAEKARVAAEAREEVEAEKGAGWSITAEAGQVIAIKLEGNSEAGREVSVKVSRTTENGISAIEGSEWEFKVTSSGRHVFIFTSCGQPTPYSFTAQVQSPTGQVATQSSVEVKPVKRVQQALRTLPQVTATATKIVAGKQEFGNTGTMVEPAEGLGSNEECSVASEGGEIAGGEVASYWTIMAKAGQLIDISWQGESVTLEVPVSTAAAYASTEPGEAAVRVEHSGPNLIGFGSCNPSIPYSFTANLEASG